VLGEPWLVVGLSNGWHLRRLAGRWFKLSQSSERFNVAHAIFNFLYWLRCWFYTLNYHNLTNSFQSHLIAVYLFTCTDIYRNLLNFSWAKSPEKIQRRTCVKI
jgi:hypothetical protein